MRAIDFDDPVYTRAQMDPGWPRKAEVAALASVLRAKLHFQRQGDLYAEPVYGRSLEVELFILEDWQRANA